MGTIGQLFPLTDNTDGAAVEQVQQQHHFISKLYRFTLGKQIEDYNKSYNLHIATAKLKL
jgi:hypothetical protein